MLGLIGFDEPYRAALVALSAQEHMMFLGKPGRAKSEFVRKFYSLVNGAKVWEVQLTKESDESRIFGIPSIEKLLKGEVEYAENIPALEADLWFADEFFDAPDVTQRGLLSLLNERRFIFGSTPRSIKLHSCIATANYTRVNEINEAVIDRFVITVNAPALSDKDRLKLYDEGTFGIDKKAKRYNLANFLQVHKNAADVKIPESIISALVEMCGPGKGRFNFSPRRERKLAKLVRVYAAIRGKTEVDPDCLEPFKWALPIAIAEKDRIEALKNLLTLTGTFDKTRQQSFQLAEVSKLIAVVDTEVEFDVVATKLKGVMAAPVSERIRREAEGLFNNAATKWGEPFKAAFENA